MNPEHFGVNLPWFCVLPLWKCSLDGQLGSGNFGVALKIFGKDTILTAEEQLAEKVTSSTAFGT